MKSSSRSSTVVLIAVLVLSATVIGLLRPRLGDRFAQAKQGSDSLLLPPAPQVLLGSLGYRAAVADILFAHTLVWSGLHVTRKVRFDYVAQYLDIVTTLDPKFREPYMYSDTLITLQTVASKREDYEAARRILERGMRERPYDTELWLVAGQYLAYVAPPYLGDEAAAKEWRLEGARRLARACELVGNNENIPYNCITAAGLFDRAGDRESMVSFLERMLNVIDDPELLDFAKRYLDRARTEREKEQTARRRLAIESAMGSDLPVLRRTKTLILGPRFDPAECAGEPEACVTSWRDWAARQPQEFAP